MDRILLIKLWIIYMYLEHYYDTVQIALMFSYQDLEYSSSTRHVVSWSYEKIKHFKGYFSHDMEGKEWQELQQ